MKGSSSLSELGEIERFRAGDEKSGEIGDISNIISGDSFCPPELRFAETGLRRFGISMGVDRK